jgi:hypothetical protein
MVEETARNHERANKLNHEGARNEWGADVAGASAAVTDASSSGGLELCGCVGWVDVDGFFFEVLDGCGKFWFCFGIVPGELLFLTEYGLAVGLHPYVELRMQFARQDKILRCLLLFIESHLRWFPV